MADVLSEGVLKKRKERPKVESEWPDDDIYKLIALVEEHRPLWDGYKLQTYKLSREILWQEIAEALEEKYTVSDCKGKWANLRVIFNTNMHKLRKGGEKKDIKWRFFLPMLFLEAADVSQSKSMETNTKHALAKPKTESDSQWNHEDTYTLIKAVEERLPLWDKLCAEYNRPKDFVWQEVAELLDEKYTLSECRDRWLGLRVTFKTIQAKSRIGAHENKEIDWPFYWDMNFLDPPEFEEKSQSSFTKEMQRIANLTKSGIKKRGSIGRPTVQYEWSDEDIQNLIEFVKPRQLLWKKDLPKNTKQRELLWQEVVDEFKQKYPVPECKAKWANLRVTYNYNLPRYRNLQAGHSPSETNRISWRFFYSMLFLDNNEKPRSTKSLSSVDQLSENTDSNNAHSDDGDEEVDEYQDFISEVFSTESNAIVSEHSSKRNSPSSSPIAEPPASKKRCLKRKTVNCHEAAVKWADPLNAKDKHSIFGEYVANELRSLEHSPDLLHKLKIFIQQKIIEVSSEQAERSFAKQSNQANDTLEQNSTTVS